MVCKSKFVRDIKKELALQSALFVEFFFIFSSSRLNSSKTDLATHLKLFFKFNFIRYGHIKKK